MSDLVVVAVAPDGERSSFVLAHGADPGDELARQGLAGEVRAVRRDEAGRLELMYAVVPDPGAAVAAPAEVPVDPGLVLEPGEVVQPYQRVAAYGVVRSARGVLLTQLSERTNASGRWVLPGGGIDPGEEPVAGLHREVFEESGQQVEEPELLEVLTSHWVGRAPSGRLEDFHAVRVVFRAWCPEPSDPVVHDVGGSTSAAAWFAPEEIRRLRVGSSFAPHLGRWLALP